MSLENVLATLKADQAQAQKKHDEFMKQIGVMIGQAESMIAKAGSGKNKKQPKARNSGKKVKIDEIIDVIKKTKKNVPIDDICETISASWGTAVSRRMVSSVISWYLRREKGKAQIKIVSKHVYCMKNGK